MGDCIGVGYSEGNCYSGAGYYSVGYNYDSRDFYDRDCYGDNMV